MAVQSSHHRKISKDQKYHRSRWWLYWYITTYSSHHHKLLWLWLYGYITTSSHHKLFVHLLHNILKTLFSCCSCSRFLFCSLDILRIMSINVVCLTNTVDMKVVRYPLKPYRLDTPLHVTAIFLASKISPKTFSTVSL